MTGGPTIDYEALHQEAMRGVVRTLLLRTAKTGLPGDHHFYISFDTQAQGVILSKRLKEKYPNEMTIVLQHRFWDLAVTDERFEVKLTFDGIPERLVVPFSAIKVFFDPSVRYGLQFEDPADIEGAGAGRDMGDEADERPVTTRTMSPRKPRPAPRAKTRPEREIAGAAAGASATQDGKATPLKPVPPRATPASAPAAPKSGGENGVAMPAGEADKAKPAAAHKQPAADGKSAPAPAAPAPAGAGAQIVSLDAFRKK